MLAINTDRKFKLHVQYMYSKIHSKRSTCSMNPHLVLTQIDIHVRRKPPVYGISHELVLTRILTCALAKVPYLKCSVMTAGSRFVTTVQKLCRRHFAGVTRQRVLRHQYNNVSNTVSYLKCTDASLNNKIQFVNAKIDLSTQRPSAYIPVALRQLLSRRAPRSRWLSLRVATTRRGRTPPTSPPHCSPAACTRSCCGLINTSVAPHYDIYMYVDILNQSK